MGGRFALRRLFSSTAPKSPGNFHVKHINFTPRSPRLPVPATPGDFGAMHTDHMLEIDFKDGQWQRPEIKAFQDLRMHPFAKVLHYSPTIFEGLKAFRGVDNEIRMFRIERNMARMLESAKRAALPTFCPVHMEHMIVDLVRKEQEWVPKGEGTSLYVRPFMMGTDGSLGVTTATEAKLCVVCSPVGPYYKTGWSPISLYADPAFVRAAPGGVGAYKMGCNYALTIWLNERANQVGCQQVLWLWGKNRSQCYPEHAGVMNVFVYWRNEDNELELVTPPLKQGLILPGVTRETILMLAREWGEMKVSERYPKMRELAAASKEGRLLEVFGAGAAAVVSPVSRIVYISKDSKEPSIIDIPPQKDPLFKRIHATITGIRYGKIDRPEWVRIVD